MTDDYAGSTATTGVVPIGGLTTGNIETSGDADWFAVTLTAGVTYQFDFLGIGTLTSPIWYLMNSVGTSALLYDFGNPASFTYTATSTGTLYLASDPGSNATGTYTISSTVLSTTLADDYAGSTATTGVVPIGGSTTGNIETSGDADWFAVTLRRA
jgi:hypothetical protein